mgnify:CR=1 FL=1
MKRRWIDGAAQAPGAPAASATNTKSHPHPHRRLHPSSPARPQHPRASFRRPHSAQVRRHSSQGHGVDANARAGTCAPARTRRHGSSELLRTPHSVVKAAADQVSRQEVWQQVFGTSLKVCLRVCGERGGGGGGDTRPCCGVGCALYLILAVLLCSIAVLLLFLPPSSPNPLRVPLLLMLLMLCLPTLFSPSQVLARHSPCPCRQRASPLMVPPIAVPYM